MCTNDLIIFVIFGVIGSLLILTSLLFLLLTIIFGDIIKRRRISASSSSPIFLIIICISCMIGFASNFAVRKSRDGCMYISTMVTRSRNHITHIIIIIIIFKNISYLADIQISVWSKNNHKYRVIHSLVDSSHSRNHYINSLDDDHRNTVCSIT